MPRNAKRELFYQTKSDVIYAMRMLALHAHLHDPHVSRALIELVQKLIYARTKEEVYTIHKKCSSLLDKMSRNANIRNNMYAYMHWKFLESERKFDLLQQLMGQ